MRSIPHALNRCLPIAVVLLGSLAAVAFAAGGAGERPKGERSKGEQAQQLIEQLGSKEYVTRRRAERELARLGLDAFDALSAAQDHPDLEIASQARYLVRQMEVPWGRDDDSIEVKEHLQGYGSLSEEDRAKRAAELAELSADKGLAALCRIVRFEKSPALSKAAAALLLEAKPFGETFWANRKEIIERELGDSRRAASEWLRTRILAETDAEAAVAAWTRYIAAERDVPEEQADASQAKNVLALLRQKAELLKRQGRAEQARETMTEMIALQTGDSQTLIALVGWLAEQQAWDLVERVAAQYAKQFEREPVLLYTLADVIARSGKEEQAMKFAEQARALNGEETQRHLILAFELHERGLIRWAEMEYRFVIDEDIEDDKIGRFGIFASYRLSELMHDQEREREAGETLGKIIDDMNKHADVKEVVLGLNLKPEAMTSRAEYFRASHFAQRKEWESQRKHLEKAIEADPTDADVLIAMYRFENSDEKYRARTVDLIEKAAGVFRQEISNEPLEANGYNQLAWLISNTTGDYDEALRFSQRSLEIAPNRAGYLDTLGRCYYAKGDLANAIKYQQQAVNLEPHTQVIARQLAFFKAELAKQQGEKK